MSSDYKALLIKQLIENFSGVTVYDEPVQQGLAEPCFIIDYKKATHARLFGNLTKTHVFLFLTYYPQSEDDKREELNNVMNIFSSGAFKYLGGKFHINSLDMEHDNEVLTISFAIDDYQQYIKDGDKITSMEGGASLGKKDN